MSYSRFPEVPPSTSLLRPGVTRSTLTIRSDYDSLVSSPYPGGSGSRITSMSSKFTLTGDPQLWGADLSPDLEEDDDGVHNPEVKEGKMVIEDGGIAMSRRGLANLGCLSILCCAIFALFIGYPITSYVRKGSPVTTVIGSNTGGVNSTGQIPSIGNYGLVDLETPKDAYTITSLKDGSKWQLVFSDEFNTDGRTFYPGDDPYWEAADLHYWATNNLEWYDPAAITTADGSLVITFEQKETHGLNYQGGMMSTWNKFCFTGGQIVASVELPGTNNVVGMWPALWTMGNLGRAGYGASLEGMWPYSYDSCDVGTAPNQTLNGLPASSTIDGDFDEDSDSSALSFLPGQKLSRCTCSGESHPGPKHTDGTFVGRSAPEIDVFEAQIKGTPLVGQVSQSAQWAPFNDKYIWDNSSDNMIIADPTISALNSYIGGKTQQATSMVTSTNQICYEMLDGCYSVYGFEYKPGFDDAYISWISDNTLSWTINAAGVGADTVAEISARPVPQEPMYIIVNLGMSENFGTVDLAHLTFPNHLRIDWIRVYQDPDNINIGCSPKDFPTQNYINTYIEAYTDPNLTTWRDDYGQPFPKNSFLETC